MERKTWSRSLRALRLFGKEKLMAMERQKRADTQDRKKTRVKEPPRRKPGSSGKGDYYHVEVRPGEEFVTFRTQDVGRRGHIQRVAGQRFSGYWTTVKWLIGKEEAHVQDAKLVPDTKAAKEVIQQLGSQPVHWMRRDMLESTQRLQACYLGGLTTTVRSAPKLRPLLKRTISRQPPVPCVLATPKS